MGRRASTRGVLIFGLLAMAASEVDGQRIPAPRGFAGVSFIAADAVGEMGTVVDRGYGLEIAGGAAMDRGGHLRLRGDAGFLVYGVERIRYCEFGCRVSSDLTTVNSIFFAGVGPEVVLAHGAIEPYLHGTAGFSWFVTSSSLDDNDGYGPYLQTTNYSDVVFGWKYGGGLRFRLGGGHRPVYLDLGVDRHDNGLADYLTRGDIVDNPDGSVTIYPNRSDADLMTFRFGVSVGFPGGH